MKIGYATEAQAAQIAGLLEYVCGVHAAGRPDLFAEGGAKYGEEDVKRLISSPDVRVISADEDGRVVGYVIAKLRDADPGPHMRRIRTLYVDDVCVSPDRARKGVGTALMNEAKRLAEELGCARMELNVWAFNEPAIRLYEKLGFTVSSMRMEYRLKQ